MRLRLFAFVFLAFGTAVSAEEMNPQVLAQRALIWVDTANWTEASLDAKALSCAMIARYKTLLYVDCVGASGPRLLRSLASASGVRAVARDYEIFPMQQHETPKSPYFPKSSGFSDLDDTGVCRITETCPDGRAKFWAQERLDADLMFKAISTIGLAKGHTKVAVVDSGFDMIQARTLIDDSLVSVAKGWDGAGDPNRDELGHGTAVAGLIGGKDGVGLAPDAKLTVYRVSESNSSGSATSSSLMMSVMKACDEGNEVINLSWGGDFDENAIFEDEAANKKFYDELAAKGCLVVKAAGNAARRIDRKSMNPDDSLLRVEATEPSGKLASFSSNGEVSAPGAGVFSLHSSQSPAVSSDAVCGVQKGAFINGTSFAAPLTAAVATETLGVLKKSPEFFKLSGAQRVATLNRVLQAANVGGGLNGLRAVLIANMLRLAPGALPAAKPDALNASFDKVAINYCAAPRTTCTLAASCQKKRECSLESRKYLALCMPPKDEIIKDLFRLADNSKSTELALGLLSHEKVFSERESVATKRRIWQNLNDQWSAAGRGDVSRAMSFDQALQVLPSLAADRSRIGLESDGDIALGNFLKSGQLMGRLSRDIKADSTTDLNRVIGTLEEAATSMGATNFVALIKEAVEKNTKPNTSTKKISTPAFSSMSRLLDALITNPKFAGSKDELMKLERNLLISADAAGLSDSTTENSYFDGPYSRNADLLNEKIHHVLSATTPLDLDSSSLLYLARKPELVPEASRAEFDLKVMDAYRKQLAEPKTVMTGVASATSQNSLDNFQAELKKLTPESQKSARESYWKNFEGAQNLKQLAVSIPKRNSYFSDYSYATLQKSPLFSGDVIHAQSRKIATRIVESPSEWQGLGVSKANVLYQSVPLLLRKETDKLLIPQLGVTIIDTLLKNAAVAKWGYFEGVAVGQDSSALRYLLENKSIRALLKADPKFMNALTRTKDDMMKRSDRYSTEATTLKPSFEEFEKP
ncbi:MAG: S8/S53 family peptidase [Bdellovibrionota bacterium]